MRQSSQKLIDVSTKDPQKYLGVFYHQIEKIYGYLQTAGISEKMVREIYRIYGNKKQKKYQRKGQTMNQETQTDFTEFLKNPFVRSVAGKKRWTASTTNDIFDATGKNLIFPKKMPIDIVVLQNEGKLRGAKHMDDRSLDTLPNVMKTLGQPTNLAFYLRADLDKYVVLDIEKTCPADMRKKFLAMPYVYGEVSMSGKGLHLVFRLPPCFYDYEAAMKQVSMNGPGKVFEILLYHYCTFTGKMIEPADPNASNEEWEEMFRELCAQQVETLTYETGIDMINHVTSCDEETVDYINERLDTILSIKNPFTKTPADFHGRDGLQEKDTSAYEYYYLLHIKNTFDGITSTPLAMTRSPDEFKRISEEYPEIPYVQRKYRYLSVEENPQFTPSERAWFIWKAGERFIPKRDKHSTRRNGMPWLLFLTKSMIARTDGPRQLDRPKDGVAKAPATDQDEDLSDILEESPKRRPT